MANTYFFNDQVLDWFKDNLKGNLELGLAYVDYGDVDDLIPGFPAVILTNAPRTRIVHATHQFRVDFLIDLWVLHANMMVGYSQRKKEDIQLCNAIQEFVDDNMQMPTEDNPDNIVSGWIESETPGVLNRKGTPIVSSRLRWTGFSLQPF